MFDTIQYLLQMVFEASLVTVTRPFPPPQFLEGASALSAAFKAPKNKIQCNLIKMIVYEKLH